MTPDSPGPSPLETLLIERITACWLQVYHADATAAQAAGGSMKLAEFATRRQDSAHRRYASAVGALAMIRRLLAPRVITADKKPESISPASPALVGVAKTRLDWEGEVALKKKTRPPKDGLVIEFVPKEGAAVGAKPGCGKKSGRPASS